MISEDDFKAASNIAELYALGRRLKASGEDAGEVNTLMARRKREFIEQLGKVCTLEKIIGKSVNAKMIVMIVPEVNDLNGNRMVIEGKTVKI
jgi:hypothetical protein